MVWLWKSIDVRPTTGMFSSDSSKMNSEVKYWLVLIRSQCDTDCMAALLYFTYNIIYGQKTSWAWKVAITLFPSISIKRLVVMCMVILIFYKYTIHNAIFIFKNHLFKPQHKKVFTISWVTSKCKYGEVSSTLCWQR